MRRSLVILAGTTMAFFSVTLMSTLASASSKILYSGSGQDFMNNAPQWAADGGIQKFSFNYSASSHQIVNFRGAYYWFCGGGAHWVTVKTIKVSNLGTFSYHSSLMSGGARLYYVVSGRFSVNRSHATISYMAEWDYSLAKVPNPYATKPFPVDACASWVRGTAALGG